MASLPRNVENLAEQLGLSMGATPSTPKASPKPKSAPKPKATPKPKGPRKKSAPKAAAASAPVPPTPPPTPPSAPAPPPPTPPTPPAPPAGGAPEPPKGGGTTSRLAGIRKGTKSVMGRPGMLALAGLLAGGGLARAVRVPQDRSELEEAVNVAMRRAKGEQVARLLEQSRMERAITQNQARLAQANPTLYTSVMAGRKVPTGAVVLGGRPRTDLMRELAASMDSGAFQKRDPLSDLMG